MINLLDPVKKRWGEPNGYREILTIAIPLIISTGSWSLQTFIDRMFLSWYSTEAIAAAMPAGMLSFTLLSFFLGTAGYVSTFVAQYKGAGYPQKIGPSLWQGIYLAMFGGVVIFLLIPIAPFLFKLANHDPEVQTLEVTYFTILCYGAFPAILANALAGFYSGLGKTWPIMWVNLAATLFNIVFTYPLVFGKFGFPELGIAGAAITTTLTPVVSVTIYIFLIFNKKNNDKYNVISGRRFDKKLFSRLLRFGMPSGTQFFLDVSAFTLFSLFLGSLGKEVLAASNISFSINSITFMPMIGLGIAISILVGQNQGRETPSASIRCVWSGFHLSFSYMSIIAVLFFVIPDLFIAPFMVSVDPSSGETIRTLCRVLLRFVAIYTLFDSFNLLFASALKGAGDTKYVMISNLVLSFLVFVLPSYLAIFYFHKGIYAAWAVATTYISLLGLNFLFRFLSGKWKTMRVIEEHCIEESPDNK
ncbi:MAG: MATE family efflux transporter [Spirochaetaceae bacterium]|nr:MATE family efflux transporter [Spirochaetaceae bacterium]